jgi:hypothetical protein
MRSTCLAACLCAMMMGPPAALGAGFAFNESMSVMAPDQPLAEEVLARASEWRDQIALDWFGQSLPPGVGKTAVHVKLSDTDDRGVTWPMDNPNRKLHRVFLRTSRAGAASGTLAHEMSHVVFAIGLAGAAPAWLDEGAASQWDDGQRVRIRSEILRSFSTSGQWPDLAELLRAGTLSAGNQGAYAAAVSLTEFLLTRGDKARLLRFAIDGQQEGWDRALHRHYGMAGTAELQRAWQTWAARAVAAR